MADETAPKKTLKQKAEHEGKELLILTVYLGFFFCALGYLQNTFAQGLRERLS